MEISGFSLLPTDFQQIETFVQDNDPKHISQRARGFMLQMVLTGGELPQSPDLNPIENLCHQRRVIEA